MSDPAAPPDSGQGKVPELSDMELRKAFRDGLVAARGMPC